jgi:hypothetical protein
MKKITFTLFAMLLFFSATFAQQGIDCDDIIIGDGTTSTYEIPINTFYCHSYTQQIYDAEELGEVANGWQISSISFYKTGTCQYTKTNQTIYLWNTNKSNFSNTTDWVPLSELTQVYAGSIYFNGLEEWLTIQLDEPFIYTGENLVVAVLNNSGLYPTCGNNNGVFKYHTANSKTLHYRVDGLVPINPVEQLVATGLISNRNNVIFTICEELPLPEYTLNPNNIIGEGAEITLVPNPIPYGGNGTAYFTTTRNCYYITDVIIGSEHLGAINSYEFVNVTAPLPVIEVVTSIYQYEITVTQFLDGMIMEPGGGAIYDCGTMVAFSFSPPAFYKIEKVLIDGVEISEAQSGGYSFQVTGNHSIEVYFISEVAIHDPIISDISIYSHANIVYIVNENHRSISEIMILDMYGRTVWQGKLQEQIAINVANGIYTVRIATDDKFITTKVSIQK